MEYMQDISLPILINDLKQNNYEKTNEDLEHDDARSYGSAHDGSLWW